MARARIDARTLRQVREAAEREVRSEFVGSRLGVITSLAALSLLSVVGWVALLSRIDPREITDVGIVSVVPPEAYLFLALLAASFVAALRMRPLFQPLLVAQAMALTFMLYGAPAFFEELPRFVTAWLHVGFVDAIARTGELFPNRDARFDWPGFFTLFAFLKNATGLDSFLPILHWIPVLTMVAYLPPLYLIYRSATGDLRLVWLAIWVFLLANWVGQDYFSPQGLNILLLLTIFAVLLTWFRREPTRGLWISRWLQRVPGLRSQLVIVDPDGTTESAPESRVDDRQQMGLVSIVAILFGMSVASHQLTPFAIIGGLVLLVMVGRLRLWGMPLLMIVLVSAWLVFMATTFLDGRLSALLSDVGRPDQFAASNVAGRLRGSDGHVLVVQGRLAFTAGFWLLALVGGLRRIRAGRLDLSLAVLAVAPFGLVFVQGYGGEMILRVYLFALPFMSFFSAAAIFPTMRPASIKLAAGVVALSLALAFGFLFTRYGNERGDIVTPEDYRALEYVKSVAEPGSIIAAPNFRVPLQYRAWEQHRYLDLYFYFSAGRVFTDRHFDLMMQELRGRFDPGDIVYLVMTRGNAAQAELLWGLTEEEWATRTALLDEELDLIYRNRDASVYRIEILDGET